LVQTRQELKGVDPETGEVLWSQFVPSFRGMNILTPLAHGDGIFTSSSRNASWFFDVTQGGEGYAVAERWSNKTHAYMSSPVKVGEVVYSHLGNGRLTAINLETGESYWTTQPMGDYWSMVHRQGTILALNEKGELLLIEASPESFNLLDQREVADAETWGHVAVSGNQIFVRELEALSAWTWDTPPAAPQAETTEASGE
ncbi:MAG: PQQ-binding-like beta-propeller repeat protein, partial [Acidobacteriota bacterium]